MFYYFTLKDLVKGGGLLLKHCCFTINIITIIIFIVSEKGQDKLPYI